MLTTATLMNLRRTPFIHTLLILAVPLLLTHCSSGSRSQKAEDGSLETIAIVGTNDIHGGLLPFAHQTREKAPSPSIEYEAGGVAVLTSYIKILKNEFKDRLVWLDGGDEFQGSLESNSEQGAPMVQFFNQAGLTAAAVGNHEFDFGLDTLKSRMSEAKYPYLAANILDASTNQRAKFPNTYPHLLIMAGKLKVGVIGLSTVDTPTTTRAINVKTLKFENLKTATLKQAQELRDLGADIVLITAHAGLVCDHARISTARLMRKSSDPQGICGDQDEIVELLQSLPPGTIDAVVSGHTHQVIHEWIANVPVIQGGAFGKYFNVIYLTYDWSQKKIVPDQTRIEGPVPVCSQVFENQGDCNGNRPAPKNGRGPLVVAKFHGKTIEPDREINQLIEATAKKTRILKEKKLGMAIRPIEHLRTGESELGNLYADAIRIASGADFAYVNSGGIRAPINAGPVVYGDVFRSVPFDNSIVTLEVKAEDLRKILQVAESGSRGFGSVSGLHLRLIDPAQEAPFQDLSGDGTFELWKINRLIAMNLPNGEPLNSKKTYTLATLDFLVTGGDDLKWPMSQISAAKNGTLQFKDTGILCRDAIVQHIERLKEVNSPIHPLVDFQNPRLKFEKVKTKIKSKRHRSRSRHSRSPRLPGLRSPKVKQTKL